MFSSRKIAAALGVMTAFLLSCGIAAAAWSSNGTGTATAKAATAQGVTTSAVAVTTGLLYPGGTGDLFIKVDNSNPFPVRVTAVGAGAGSVTAAGGIGSCSTHGVALSAAQTGLTFDIGASSSGTRTFAGVVSMSTASESGCQGATFTIPVAITAQSN